MTVELALADFAGHPLFDDLASVDLSDLAVVHDLAAGESLAIPTERIVLVTAGRVGVENADAFERLAGPGDLIGLLRPGHSLRVDALQDSQLLLLGPIDLDGALADSRKRRLLSNATSLAELEIRRIQAERLELEASLEDFFEPHSGEVARAPYVVDGARMLFVVARDVELSRLPPGLSPLPLSDGRFLLAFCHYPHFGPSAGFGPSYDESLVMVPCWDLMGGGPGFYCPEVWPESMMAVIVGGELFGFPKRYGRVTLGADHAHVDLGGTQAYLRWTGAKPLSVERYMAEMTGALLGEDDPEGRVAERLVGFAARFTAGPLVRSGTPLPLYVRRSAGRRDFGAVEWAVDELAWVPFDLRAHHQLVELEGLAFRGWGRLRFAEVERAFFAEVDLTMAEARPIRDLRSRPIARLRTAWFRMGARKERLWATLRRS